VITREDRFFSSFMRTERLWDSRSFCLKSGVSTLERMKSQNSHEKFTVNTSCRYLVISGRSPQGQGLAD